MRAASTAPSIYTAAIERDVELLAVGTYDDCVCERGVGNLSKMVAVKCDAQTCNSITELPAAF